MDTCNRVGGLNPPIERRGKQYVPRSSFPCTTGSAAVGDVLSLQAPAQGIDRQCRPERSNVLAVIGCFVGATVACGTVVGAIAMMLDGVGGPGPVLALFGLMVVGLVVFVACKDPMDRF